MRLLAPPAVKLLNVVQGGVKAQLELVGIRPEILIGLVPCGYLIAGVEIAVYGNLVMVRQGGALLKILTMSEPIRDRDEKPLQCPLIGIFRLSKSA